MRRCHGTIAALALGLALSGPGPLAAQERFPHEAHQRLFPLCEGCHDVEAGDPVALHPEPERCASCHDGEQAPVVDWTRPPPDSGFAHPGHGPGVEVALACADCHPAGGEIRLAVDPGACAACHEPHHVGGARCRLCHSPSPRESHAADTHRGCAGAGCHEAALVSTLAFDRQLCLLCHSDREDHKAGRRCGVCHAVGQPSP